MMSVLLTEKQKLFKYDQKAEDRETNFQMKKIM